MTIPVHVWVAAASLHDRGRKVFTSKELETEVERLFGDVRPGVATHISAHANAWAPKQASVV